MSEREGLTEKESAALERVRIDVGDGVADNSETGSDVKRLLTIIDRLLAERAKLVKVAEAARAFADEIDRQFGGTAIPAEIDTLRDALSALYEKQP